MDRGAWWVNVLRVTESGTTEGLNTYTHSNKDQSKRSQSFTKNYLLEQKLSVLELTT